MRVSHLVGFIIGFLFCDQLVESQTTNVSFERITTKDGLSQSTVNYIIQDKKGFMWFATYGGINKYDGYNIKVYRNVANDRNSLSNNGIIFMFEDHEGFIWAVNNTNKGLHKFDPVSESFTRYIHDPKDSTSLSSNEVYRVMQDKSGNIWINTRNALNLLEYKKDGNKKLTQFKHFYNTTNKRGFSLTYENRKGELLLFADSLYYLDRRTDKISCAQVLLNNSIIKSISEDKAGNLWLGTEEDGIIKLAYNPKTKSYARAGLNALNSISHNRNYVLIDDKDRIWICTETKGLFQYAEKDGHLIQYLNEKNNPNTISDNTIYSLCLDRSGILWIGTFSQGLCKFDVYQKPFIHYKVIPGNSNSLSGNVISSIHSNTPGELWVGVDSDDGINRFIFCKDKEPQVLHYKNKFAAIGSNRILCLLQRRNGDVWTGNASENLLRLIPKEPNQPPDQKKYKVNRWTFSMYEDRDGTLWGGTWGAGLWKFDDKTAQFTYFTNNPNNPNSLCDNIVWAISEDNYGNLWIGGHGEGLSILPATEKNKANPHFIRFKHEEGNAYSLSDNTIHSIFKDHKGNMWIGTGAGLNKVVNNTIFSNNITSDCKLNFFSYHVKNGLQSEVIVGILEDNSGNLWLTTSNGLSKFNIAKGLVTNYDDKDGLQSNEFWHNAYFKDQDGRMYVGGQNGFNAFWPDSIQTNRFLPDVVFTELKIFNTPVNIGERFHGDVILSKSINHTSSITLSYENNAFTLGFAALHFIQPKKNQYAFKLEGYDADWNYVKNKREATYTNLNPGRYRFMVKASNNDGIWNNKASSIEIIILPPWWRSAWFRTIVLVFLILSVVAIIYIRTAALRNRQRELTELVLIRTNELEKINADLLQERQFIEEQKENLKQANKTLLEQNKRIEEQSEELRSHSENLKQVNDLLLEKQRLIQLQADALEETNHKLSVLNSTKDRLFSIIAHDLRNPFHAVSGFSELLIRDYKKISQEKIDKYLDLINRASVNGYLLLENLLQWSRAQTENISFDPISFNLLDCSDEVIQLSETEATRKNIRLIQTVSKEVMVFADENMVKTILRNLISNAIKFTNESGEIIISAIVNNSLVEIGVADNGVGISPENVKLLFYIDTNVSTKGTAMESGTGLGLILCKEFVERNSGKIWVESEPGKGSTFIFTLPVA